MTCIAVVITVAAVCLNEMARKIANNFGRNAPLHAKIVLHGVAKTATATARTITTKTAGRTRCASSYSISKSAAATTTVSVFAIPFSAL